MADVTVTREIAAPAERVWELVSDVTRMGEWSPESTGAKWTGGADGPAPGARFTGTNKLGKRTWATQCQITDSVPGEIFAFEVKGGPLRVARWEYRFEPDGSGCRVSESWTDQRGRIVHRLGKAMTGVDDRATHNRQTMEATLEALDRAATSAT